jgi:transcriptional regulator with XRE-family HTH domain
MDGTLGTWLRALREQRGWTQHHLARVAGVNDRTVQRIEHGNRPRPDTLKAIAAAFDVDVSKLRTGVTAATLAALEDSFLCPHCGAELVERTFVEHQCGDAEFEVFACGATRGWTNRPCPKDPRFPRFEDYVLTCFS